jgi:tyrosyl-tRNA synthetase
MTDPIQELLTRRVQQVLPTKESLAAKLQSGQKIRLYQGFDPSSPNLHIGHLVGILQLKMFQELGHEVIFLIGDFTGMIGDPSDKNSTRPKLTREQVMENAATYQDQVGRILNFSGDNPVQLMFNSTWNDQLTFAKVLELSSHLTVQQLLERDMFQDRLKNSRPIHLHEFMYPLIQGYDSVAMEVDLEVGGNDQLFNMMVGRHLVKTITQKDKFVITTKLLTDETGTKIGKTTGNAINLFDAPEDLYGAIMSQPDSAVIPAFELATLVPLADVSALKEEMVTQPMVVKKRLAFEIVSLCQGEDRAQAAQHHFESLFQKQGAPAAIPESTLSQPNLTLMEALEQLLLGDSNSDRKRLIRDGAVSVNDTKMTDPHQPLELKPGDIIKYGKHTFKKIVLE